MRILGIDPGSIKTGFAIIEMQPKSHDLRCLSGGTIYLDEKADLADRLLALDADLKTLIKKHRPDVLAIETLFFAKNAQSALKLGHARGVILRRAAEAKLGIFEYAPAEVKSAIGGSGRAKKDQLARLLRFYLKLPSTFEFSSEDHSDALAIAVTHAQSGKIRNKLNAIKDSRGPYDRTSFWQTSF